MATTTATFTLASTDLISDTINMQVSSTLTTAGTSTGLSETTGIPTKVGCMLVTGLLFLGTEKMM